MFKTVAKPAVFYSEGTTALTQGTTAGRAEGERGESVLCGGDLEGEGPGRGHGRVHVQCLGGKATEARLRCRGEIVNMWAGGC